MEERTCENCGHKAVCYRVNRKWGPRGGQCWDPSGLAAEVERLRGERRLLRSAAIELLVKLDSARLESREKSVLKRALTETAGLGGGS